MPSSDDDDGALSRMFAASLVQCIRDQAQEAANSFTDWANSCLATTAKVDIQLSILENGPIKKIFEAYGYSAAVWCAFYSVRLGQPVGEFNSSEEWWSWYHTLLCPWELDKCGWEPLGYHGPEERGVPVRWSKARDTVDMGGERYTASCGLCAHLQRELGPPPFVVAEGAHDDPELYKNVWDMHPVGMWLANHAAKVEQDLSTTMEHITHFRGSYGPTGFLSVVHGFLGQSCRLLSDAHAQRRDVRSAWRPNHAQCHGTVHASRLFLFSLTSICSPSRLPGGVCRGSRDDSVRTHVGAARPIYPRLRPRSWPWLLLLLPRHWQRPQGLLD